MSIKGLYSWKHMMGNVLNERPHINKNTSSPDPKRHQDRTYLVNQIVPINAKSEDEIFGERHTMVGVDVDLAEPENTWGISSKFCSDWEYTSFSVPKFVGLGVIVCNQIKLKQPFYIKRKTTTITKIKCCATYLYSAKRVRYPQYTSFQYQNLCVWATKNKTTILHKEEDNNYCSDKRMVCDLFKHITNAPKFQEYATKFSNNYNIKNARLSHFLDGLRLINRLEETMRSELVKFAPFGAMFLIKFNHAYK